MSIGKWKVCLLNNLIFLAHQIRYKLLSTNENLHLQKKNQMVTLPQSYSSKNTKVYAYCTQTIFQQENHLHTQMTTLTITTTIKQQWNMQTINLEKYVPEKKAQPGWNIFSSIICLTCSDETSDKLMWKMDGWMDGRAMNVVSCKLAPSSHYSLSSTLIRLLLPRAANFAQALCLEHLIVPIYINSELKNHALQLQN